ncbi:hypothetical protein ACLOJK_007263 [Asimina triloba]
MCGGDERRRISGGLRSSVRLLHPCLSPLFSAQMTGKKGIITADDLASLRLRYHIPDYLELLPPSAGETFRSHREGCIYLNERMFKAGVWIPLDFGIFELLHICGVSPIQEGEGLTRAWGIPVQWNNELPEWHSTKGVFLRWCEGLPLLGASGVPSHGEFGGGGTWAPRRALAPPLGDLRHQQSVVPMIERVRQGKEPMALGKVAEEDMERWDEENLQLGLALSREGARRFDLSVASPEALGGPSLLGSMLPPSHVGDVEGDSPSPNPALGLATPKTLMPLGQRRPCQGVMGIRVEGVPPYTAGSWRLPSERLLLAPLMRRSSVGLLT